MKFSLLKQRSPEYDDVLWRELDVLYEGGYKAMRRAGQYIHPLDGEKPQRYQDRLKLVSYIGYMAQIIDGFVSSLFAADLDITEAVDAADNGTPGKAPPVPEFWLDFSKNADMKSTPFSDVMKCIVREALLKRRAVLAVDLPAPKAQPVSRADEIALGADRAYCFPVEICELVDWAKDDDGCFTWAIVYTERSDRTSPTASRATVTYGWKVWTLGPPNGALVAEGEALTAHWQLFELTVPLGWKEWDDELDIPMTGEGKTSFDRIPLMEFELPHGLWAGNFLGPMAREHWSRRSQLVGSEGRNMVAIPFIEAGSTDDDGLGTDAIDPKTQLAMRQKGILTVPNGGTLGFAEPEGKAYAIVDSQLGQLKDEMFRVAHQMAMSTDNSSSTMRRSGASKQQDKKDMATVLESLSGLVKSFAVQVYECIAQARGERDVVWTARGLDRYVDADRTDLLAEAVALDAIAIPSQTFKAEYKTRTALALVPNLPAATQDIIRAEIIKGVESEVEMGDILRDRLLEEPDQDDTGNADDKEGAAPPAAKPASKANGKPAPKAKSATP